MSHPVLQAEITLSVRHAGHIVIRFNIYAACGQVCSLIRSTQNVSSSNPAACLTTLGLSSICRSRSRSISSVKSSFGAPTPAVLRRSWTIRWDASFAAVVNQQRYVYMQRREIGTGCFEEPRLRNVELHCLWRGLTEGVEIGVEVIVCIVPDACGGFHGLFVLRETVGGGSEDGNSGGARRFSLRGGEDLGVEFWCGWFGRRED